MKKSARNRHLIWPGVPAVGAVFAAALGGWDTAPAQDSAVPTNSAAIELREGITDRELATGTRVVMLGTGTPIPDAYRAGSSVAVIHKGEAYLFDAGSGAVRNATTARYKYDIPSLYPSEICCLFLTHMHSDHTLDFVELNFTLWWRRREPLLAFGPTGLEEMTDAMVAMMQPDIHIRTSGNQPGHWLPIRIALSSPRSPKAWYSRKRTSESKPSTLCTATSSRRSAIASQPMT